MCRGGFVFDAFVWSIFMVLILLGTVAFCYIIMLKLLLPKCKGEYFVLLPYNEKSVNIRNTVYGTRLKLNLYGDGIISKIIVLDCGICDKEKGDLLEICRECNGIYYIKQEDIKEFFDGRI